MRGSIICGAKALVVVMLLAGGLSACYPNVPIARFQLINQTPHNITYFAVARSEAAVREADNLLAGVVPADSISDADVARSGEYWLRAVANVDGTDVEHIRGPVSMPGGTVGWTWYMNGDNVVEGTDTAAVFGQSDLPVLVIDTNGQAIPDEPKINATLHVFDRGPGELNRPALSGADLTTPVAVERRGFSTQTFPKASWTMETRDENNEDTDVSLLGMPEEEDWVLYGPWMDRSLIRNVLGYELWGALGWYTPQTRFCEVYLYDDTGESLAASYVGVYVLTEKIKRDDVRLDIADLDPDENAEPEVTGGYVLEMREPDRLDPNELALELRGEFVVTPVSPNSDKITPEQAAWIHNYVRGFESALFASNFRDPELGYASYIDEDSFIDYMLLQEFFKNRDAFHSSTFLYKDREDVLHMGPIWDLNIAMGYFSFQGIQGTGGWLLTGGGGPVSRSSWPARLLEDPAFAQRYIARWRELREGVLANAQLQDRIDSIARNLETAQARQFIRWPSLGMTLFPDINFLMFTGPHPDSYQGELDYLYTWLRERGAWMDENIGALAP